MTSGGIKPGSIKRAAAASALFALTMFGGVASANPQPGQQYYASVWVKGGRWQLCSDARYQGQCVTVGPGRYPSFRDQGMNNAISSVRYLGGG